MPKFEITAPDGRKYEVQAPEGASQDEVLAYAKENYKSAMSEPETSTSENIKQGAGNLLAGAVRGAGSIGATLLAPIDMAKDALDGKGLSLESNRQRRADMDSALQSMGAEPESWMYKGGKLAGEIAGTAGAGGVMANGVRAVGATRAMSGLEPITNAVAAGLETGGFRVGELAGTVPGAVARVATGAATGGASAALVNPEDAGVGAIVGGAVPAAVRGTGQAFYKARQGMQSILGKASPEVQQLAMRAEELGIKIPADRILDSKALNAMASSLNYIPLSGRTATEEAMNSQLNKALSRTFGQDSSNVKGALRFAQEKLGGKFEKTLTENGVTFDRQLLDDLASVFNRAESELGSEGLRPIESKIKEIVAKGESGLIDGQAAYNIKRDLDRIGKSNAPNAWHALELKGALMDALDRSLGPEAAAEFATVRQQYSNMLSLEKLAKNGVDGEISVARLANLPNINNPQLQEIADIAAQFVKPREAAHGQAQRVFGVGTLGAAGFGAMGVPGAAAAAIAGAGAMGAGRMANSALNSQTMRNAVLKPALQVGSEPSAMGALTKGAARALPLIGAAAMGANAVAAPVDQRLIPVSQRQGIDPSQAQAQPIERDPRLIPMSQRQPESPIAEPLGTAEPEPDHIGAIGSATNIDQAIQAAGAAVRSTQQRAESQPLVIQAPAPPPPPPVPEKVSMTIPGGSSEEPASVWFGRRGDGYQGSGDAFLAMRAREKMNPNLAWRVEEMPSGRYRIAGYEQAGQMQQENSEQGIQQGLAFDATPQSDGTLAIRGNPEAIRQTLAQQGIRGIPMRDGVMVGVSQAQAAMGVLQQFSQA